MSKNITLELSDIIEIISPSNQRFHNKYFIIRYLDDNKIKIQGKDSLEIITLNIINNSLSDKSIQSIILLNRNEKKGYARQNNLIIGEWIDIYFNDEIPIVKTGIITNLEEDRIEIKLFPDDIVIYIDFEYKGIPEEIPIEKIILRNEPDDYRKDVSKLPESVEPQNEPQPKSQLENPIKTVPILTNTINTGDVDDDDDGMDNDSLNKQKLKEEIINADQIIFGSSLGEISQVVEISEKEKRYGIKTQTDDLLDELLAKIPNNKRSNTILNNIHIIIERYKQLRATYSEFDENENIVQMLKNGDNFKPIVEKLQKLNKNFKWIIPVSRNKKKIYDLDEIDLDDDNIVNVSLANDRIAESNFFSEYSESTSSEQHNKYTFLYNKLSPHYTPFITKSTETDLISKPVLGNIESLVDNIDEYSNLTFHKENIHKKKYFFDNYIPALSKLEKKEVEQNVFVNNRVNISPNDTITVKSFVTLPYKYVNRYNFYLPKTNLLEKSNLHLNYLPLWSLFDKNRLLNIENVTNIEKDFYSNSDSYLSNFTEYICSETIEDTDKYNKFINTIIPNSKIIFDLIKNNKKKTLSSFKSIINSLEAFNIYADNINYKLYSEINYYLNKEITGYIQEYNKKRGEFKNLDDYYYGNKTLYPYILKPIKNEAYLNIIKENYSLNNLNYKNKHNVELTYSSSEIIRKMLLLDSGNVFMSSISKENLNLISGFNFKNIAESDIQKINTSEKQEDTQCSTKVLSKKYL